MGLNMHADSPQESPQPTAKKPSWLKSGAEAQEELAAEEQKQQAETEQRGKMWRFWLKPEESGVHITFVDGALIEDGPQKGMLDAMIYREHTVRMGANDWRNFVCVSEEGPCPICDSGNKYATVQVFTVIDHREFTVKNGPNAGKTYKDRPKLFVAKAGTRRKLQKAATKRGGIAGWTCEVGRTDGKTARVGDEFEWEGQVPDLVTAFGEQAVVADYATELPYFPAEELAKMGLGPVTGTIGAGFGDLPADDEIPF